MAKDSRLYAKFTLDFPDHPKIMCLPVEAKWALVEMTIYSRRMLTDGFLAKGVALARWGASVCQLLLENDPQNPSLIEVENGYQIHDFADHQTTKADLLSLSEKRRAAGQKGGRSKALALAKQNASKTPSKKWPETETENNKETSQIEDPRDDVERICNTLSELMVANGCRKPAITKAWRNDARLLLDRDGVALEAAIAVLRWSQANEFWKSNIHSPRKFREKFDALQLQMQRDGGHVPLGSAGAEDWLRECWSAADVDAVMERTGFTYYAPDPPDDALTREKLQAFHKTAQQNWIRDNRERILARLASDQVVSA